MMIRRAAAISILSAAALFFAGRFHGPQSGAVVQIDEPFVATPAPPTSPAATSTEPPAVTDSSAPDAARPTTPTTPRTATTVASTMAPATTTTIPLPDATEGTVYEGARIYTRWGWIKVEITVIDQTMVDIDVVMTPKATKRSEALTAEYEPTLRYQALTRQSPHVDVITGATVISEGYGASVAAAMREAGLWPPSG